MTVIAVVGGSGSGKTTLIRGLLEEFGRRGRTAAVVKHCGHGFDLGGPSKDSTVFLRAGASGVALAAPEGLALLYQPAPRPSDLELAARFPDVDFVIVEGGQANAGIPKIEVLRRDVSKRRRAPEAEILAYVADRPVRTSKPVFAFGEIGPLANLVESVGSKRPRQQARRRPPP